MTRTTALIALAAMAALAGCFPLRKSAEDVSGMGAGLTLNEHGDPSGVLLHAVGGEGGLQAAFEVAGQQYHRAEDPEGDTHLGVGAGFAARVSLLGLIADDHRLERYFDVGGSAGVLGSLVRAPPSFVTTRGEAYYGGWTELGLMDSGDGYLALTGDLRVSDATESWDDVPLQVTIGVAWRSRTRPSPRRGYGWH